MKFALLQLTLRLHFLPLSPSPLFLACPFLQKEINGPARYSYLRLDSNQNRITSIFDRGSLLQNLREVYESMGRDVSGILADQEKLRIKAEGDQARMASHVV